MFAENDDKTDNQPVLVADKNGVEIDIAADVDQVEFSPEELEAMPEDVRERVVKQGKNLKTVGFQKKHWRGKHDKINEAPKDAPEDAPKDAPKEAPKDAPKETAEEKEAGEKVWKDKMEVLADRDLNFSQKHVDQLAAVAASKGVTLREALKENMFTDWKVAEDSRDKAKDAVPSDDGGGSEKADSEDDFDKIMKDPNADEIIAKMDGKTFEKFSKYVESKEGIRS